MNEDRIRVVVKRVGCRPSVELVKPTLEAFQAIVGGYITPVGTIDVLTSSGVLWIDAYANEEGIPRQLPPNFQHPNGVVILGDVVYVAIDRTRGVEISLPEDIAAIIASHVESYSPATDGEDLAS